jgi:excisionase family DNA binding protein
MSDPDNLRRMADIAQEMGTPLYRRFSEKDTAEKLGVSLPTLRRMRAEGKIAFLRIGDRKVEYFGFQIVEYLLGSIKEAEWEESSHESSKSEITGSQKGAGAKSGTERGSTTRPAKRDALASALRTLRPRKKS